MKKTVRKTESGYPLMRYLSLLLVVALLFSGVTFARYALERNGSVNTGVALFDASYTVEGVNSLTFGNQSYWMNYSNQWYAQGEGSARTVRIGMQNKSDVKVRANVLHMEGPAEFWENIALQLVATAADNSVAAGDPLTTQYVLADFLRVRNEEDDDGNPYEHNHTYGGYIDWDNIDWDNIDWDNNETVNGAQNGVFNTEFSDEFGAVEGIGDADLTMRGGIDATFDADGNVISVSESSVTASWETAEEDTWSMTITASMQPVTYSVGFARKQDQQTLPVFYLDCGKEVPYYSIDITLPDTDYFTMDAKGTTVENGVPKDVIDTTSVIAFLTWTNSSGSDDLEFSVAPEKLQNIASNGGEFNKAQVTGYHFNYTDVPAQRTKEENEEHITEYITTTVRMNKTVMEWNEKSETWKKLDTPTIAWEHVASISSGDGVYAHPLEPQDDGSYKCSGKNPVTIASGVLGQGEYDGSFSSDEFEKSVREDESEVCYATEKGYEVRFSVSFVQASEQP